MNNIEDNKGNSALSAESRQNTSNSSSQSNMTWFKAGRSIPSTLYSSNKQVGNIPANISDNTGYFVSANSTSQPLHFQPQTNVSNTLPGTLQAYIQRTQSAPPSNSAIGVNVKIPNYLPAKTSLNINANTFYYNTNPNLTSNNVPVQKHPVNVANVNTASRLTKLSIINPETNKEIEVPKKNKKEQKIEKKDPVPEIKHEIESKDEDTKRLFRELIAKKVQESNPDDAPHIAENSNENESPSPSPTSNVYNEDNEEFDTIGSEPFLISVSMDEGISSLLANQPSLISPGRSETNLSPVEEDYEEEEIEQEDKTTSKDAVKTSDTLPSISPSGLKIYSRDSVKKLQLNNIKFTDIPNDTFQSLICDANTNSKYIHSILNRSHTKSHGYSERKSRSHHNADNAVYRNLPRDRRGPLQHGNIHSQSQMSLSEAIHTYGPLHTVSNPWKPGSKEGLTTPFGQNTLKIVSILNKFTVDKKEILTKQLVDLVKTVNADQLIELIDIIFEKAYAEQHFCSLYSELCYKLSQIIELDPPRIDDVLILDKSGQVTIVKKALTFKRQLLNKCSSEFETGSTPLVKTETQSQADFEHACNKQRNRMLGSINFIGELFKKSMVGEKVMARCVYTLISKSDTFEEALEELCKLLTTIGSQLDASKDPNLKQTMNLHYSHLAGLVTNKSPQSVSSRTRFLIMDLLDLRYNRWKSRKEEIKAKTLEEWNVIAAEEKKKKDARMSGGRVPGYHSNFADSREFNTQQRHLHQRQPFTNTTDNRRPPPGFPSKKDFPPQQVQLMQSSKQKFPSFSQTDTNNKAYPSPNNEFYLKKRSPSPVEKSPSPAPFDEDKLINKISSYYDSKDVDILIDFFNQIPTQEHSKLVFHMINVSFDKSDAVREDAVRLLVKFHKEKKLQSESVFQGVKEISQLLDDLKVDYPLATNYFATFLGILIHERVVTMQFVIDLFGLSDVFALSLKKLFSYLDKDTLSKIKDRLISEYEHKMKSFFEEYQI